MKKENKYESQIPDKAFFKILFLVPLITLIISLIFIFLMPDEPELDSEPITFIDMILLCIFSTIVWFIISLITYKITKKKYYNKLIINQESNTTMQETRKSEKKLVKSNMIVNNKNNDKVICSCKGDLTGEKQKEMASLLPFVYKNYVKRGTIVILVITAFITIMYHNLKGSISFFIIMELFMVILYKKQLGNLCKKAFLKSLRKNPDIDTSFVINFYKEYIEISGEHGSSKIDNNRIVNKAQTNASIYLQTSDNKVIPINKEECSKETLNYIEKMFNITQNNKNTLYRKLLTTLSSALVLLLIINYITSLPSYDNYSDIEKYVNSNYTELEKVAKDYMNNKESKMPKHVASIYVYSPKEPYVKIDNTIVEFNTGAKGLVPSSIYYGFYYSEKDVPACFQNEECNLTKKGKNKWEWNDGGDNGGTTIKIRDNWYYCEAHF